jgi:hypothetical protein
MDQIKQALVDHVRKVVKDSLVEAPPGMDGVEYIEVTDLGNLSMMVRIKLPNKPGHMYEIKISGS